MQRLLTLFALIQLIPLPAVAQEPITELQTLLADRDCYTLTVDGAWGPGTQKAVNAFSKASGLAIERPITAEAIDAAKASNARCPVSKYVPLTSLPHPGEFFFNINEVRAWESEPADSCWAAVHSHRPPREEPAIKVGWGPGEPVDGNRFAITLMGPTSYLMRTAALTERDLAQVESAKSLLLEWARADAMRQFEHNNGRNWWAVYQAFPAVLLAYSALDHDGC